MTDGWIVLLLFGAMFTIALMTSIICGAVERIAKYRVDRQSERT